MVDHLAGDDFLGVLLALQITPADLGAGTIDGDDRTTLGVLGHDHDGRDVVAAVQRGLAALVLDLARGDHGFHLAADVDQDLLPIDEHDGALDELTTAQLRVLRLFVLFEQRAHAHILGVAAYLRP